MRYCIVFLLIFVLGSCKTDKKSDHKSVETSSENELVEGREMETQKNFAAIGLGYALATKAQLGKNLMKAIQEKGTVGAIGFCTINALKLTDSMAVLKKAVIKRVSDKPRNPDNQAKEDELDYISSFKKIMEAGDMAQPIVKRNKGEVAFYAPIITNAMCLQCHGKPNEQIEPATLKALKDLYPSDKAIGYDMNEVRGIWSIHFKEDITEF
ncbi:MAG: DUF3365 domain-containing protein [Flavobacteriaceae bacterium]